MSHFSFAPSKCAALAAVAVALSFTVTSSARAQDEVNVYFHVFDEILGGDIGPFATGGYEVDLTSTGKTVFRVNTALGISFL